MTLNENQEAKEEELFLKQWISSVVKIECDDGNTEKSQHDKIVGPPSLLKTEDLMEQELSVNFKILVKIDEKVYIDALDIYETQSNSLMSKIEAQNEETSEWVCLWHSDQPRHVNSNIIFQPIVTPTMFKSNFLRLNTKCANFIDAIGKVSFYKTELKIIFLLF